MERLDQTIFLFEALLQYRTQLVEIVIQQQQLGLVGIAVFVVELESEFGAGTNVAEIRLASSSVSPLACSKAVTTWW